MAQQHNISYVVPYY